MAGGGRALFKAANHYSQTIGLKATHETEFPCPAIRGTVLYRYRFTRPDEGGSWWKREPVGLWLPPLAADDAELHRFLETQGWLAPDEPDETGR